MFRPDPTHRAVSPRHSFDSVGATVDISQDRFQLPTRLRLYFILPFASYTPPIYTYHIVSLFNHSNVGLDAGEVDLASQPSRLSRTQMRS